VSGGGCCPLACRRGLVCVGRVVVSPCCFMHVSPSFSCASAWSHSCALSASLVVVTMGSLHMVSERVQPATWDHYGFR
jgi:hypothetical protein